MSTLLAAARRIEESRIEVEDLGLRRPSLDDVFLALTSGSPGAPTEEAPGPAAQSVAT
jgi:ABC-2 type transport system ATP-binding protein